MLKLPKTPVWTWLPGANEPTLAAQLHHDGDRAGLLVYTDSYLQQPGIRLLDPSSLRPYKRGERLGQTPVVVNNGGFPGVILDAAPSGYGKDALERKHGRELDTLQLLELGPADGVGAIEVCTNIERKLGWQAPKLDDLLHHLGDLDDGAPSSRAIRRLHSDDGTSAGGERPKTTIEHEGVLWMAKLQDRGDVPHMPTMEYVVMSMAKELGLNVPGVLLKKIQGHEVYLIERFDRYGKTSMPGRHLYASAFTILNLEVSEIPTDPEPNPHRSYLVLAEKLRRWNGQENARQNEAFSSTLQRDVQEIWKRLAYNSLVGNSDDHPRNHGFLHKGLEWSLAPLFDVTPLSTYRGLQAMAVTAHGSREIDPDGLLRVAPHFDLTVEEAGQWIINAAEHVSKTWHVEMSRHGMARAAIERVLPAFNFAHAISEDVDLIVAAVDRAESSSFRRVRNTRSFIPS